MLEAAEGSEALALIERTPDDIALAITDLVMPGMNGRELADRLVARRPTLKVLFTSGYPADMIVRRGVGERTVAPDPA